MKEHEFGGKESPSQDTDEFGATVGCPGCNAIKDNKGHQAIQIVAECELKDVE